MAARLVAQVIPLLTPALRRLPFEQDWYWTRASGALRRLAGWTGLDIGAFNAAMMVFYVGPMMIPMLAKAIPSSPFFDDTVSVWLVAGDLVCNIAGDICCMPPNHFLAQYHMFAVAKAVLLVYLFRNPLPYALVDSLFASGPMICVQFCYASMLLLRRRHLRKRLLGHNDIHSIGLPALLKRVEQDGDGSPTEDQSAAT